VWFGAIPGNPSLTVVALIGAPTVREGLRKGTITDGRRPGAIIALLACAAFAAFAQDAAPATEFEAASVQPSQPPQPGVRYDTGCRTPGPGLFVCTNAPFRLLVLRAYGVEDYRLSGPAWMGTERFDIAAKVSAGLAREQIGPMLQKLLAGRFGLTVHRETKEMQVYALTVDKGGPRLRESKADDTPVATAPPPPDDTPVATEPPSSDATRLAPRPPEGGTRTANLRGVPQIQATRMPIPGLAAILERRLGRHVVDETGLRGHYDFTLRFAGTSASELAPSIFTAVQNQLGLKLEPKKVPTEIIVVDAAKRTPSAN